MAFNPADFVVTAERTVITFAQRDLDANADPDLQPTAARDLEAIVYVTYTGFMQHHHCDPSTRLYALGASQVWDNLDVARAYQRVSRKQPSAD